MASSLGVSAVTGKRLSDWQHVEQSIGKILKTPIGARVMRRDFGSDLPDLVDQKMTPRNILAVYAAAATAIEKWEPRFRMKRGQVLSATAGGQLHLIVTGVYFPRGHLGDYSVSEDRTARVLFTR